MSVFDFSVAHVLATVAAVVLINGMKQYRRPRFTHLMQVTWAGWLPHGHVVGAVVEITRRRVFAPNVVEQKPLCFVKTEGYAMRCAESNSAVPYWIEHQIEHSIHSKPIHTVPENIAVARMHEAREHGFV